MTAFFRDRRSSWLACVAKAFPCGFGAKNEEGESKTARKIGRVIASKPHRNACYADYSWLNGDFSVNIKITHFWEPGLGFRYNFFAAVIKIILKTFGKLCCLCRLYKLDMQICLMDQDGYLSTRTAWNASLSFTIVSSQFTPRLLFSFFVFSD